MEVKGIGDVPQPFRQQIQDVIKRLQKLPEKERKDKVTISSEVRKLVQYVQRVKNIPTVREDKVAEVKEKMRKGAYLSPEVIEKTIKKIIKDNL